MGLQISPQLTLTASRTVDLAAATQATIQQSGFNISGPKFTDTSTPAVTKESYRTLTFASGVVNIDLTALVDAVGVTFDGTGLKVQTVLIKNPAGNSAIVINPGGANPYYLFGTGQSLTIPGHATIDCGIGMVLPEGLADVGPTAKTIQVVGVTGQSFHIGLTLG